jgi:hypothetical protein
MRRVEVVRPDGRVVVTHGGGYGGYVQRSFSARNEVFVQRTYYSHGVAYERFYRPYSYGGIGLHIYVPDRFFAPAFYGWVDAPWEAPVVYRWGWAGNPWYGHYGAFFTPYPVYSSPALWLTDYLVAKTLESAFQDRMAANGPTDAPPYSGPALTPDVKDAIADEVRRQLAQERAEREAMAQNSAINTPPMFSDAAPHIFVVANSLYVASQGQECIVTEGDVLQLSAPPPPNAGAADLQVLASKVQECPKGAFVSVQLQDLQDMQNHMRETLDQGLGDMQAHPGQGGLPAPPPQAIAAPMKASFVSAAPPRDQNVAAELSQQAHDAAQAEQEVVNQALVPVAALPSPAGGPATISAGQTVEQVIATLGTPQSILDLGSKKIYVYKDMKITFIDGRVSDAQ